MAHLKKTPEEAFSKFRKFRIPPFRDISTKKCQFECTILDCLRALETAARIDWFGLDRFNVDSYDTYSHRDNGNISEIIPHKIFVFKTPPSKRTSDYGGAQKTYTDYLAIFAELKIGMLIDITDKETPNREVERLYKERGVKYQQLYLRDEIPSLSVVELFVNSIEQTKEN